MEIQAQEKNIKGWGWGAGGHLSIFVSKWYNTLF